MKELEFFKLENRVLFEAAAAAEIVDAAEMAQNPDNANISESAKQEQKDRDALKNAPPENPAANQNDDVQVDPAEIADIDAVIEQLIEGEIPSVEADGIDIDADIDNDIIEAEADDFIDGEIVDNGLTISTDKELVVINSTVADKDAIIAELKPDQEVLILEDGNGLDELNEYLDNSETKYSAIHFVTHGNDGYISVNGELIDSENFDAAQWQEIGEHLTEDGDILLYGCDTAATAEGKLLTEMISEASGADVAASVDATGISGDWDLEYTVGDVDVDEITVENFEHNLTNYTVTNLNDSGSGSLRQAVTDANANAGTDEITFSVDGTIKFNSEIKISDDVAIIGNGTGKTILDGKSVSRFFSIAKNVDVEISDMTLQNGKSKISGGAISNDGNLTIDNAVFLSNTSVSEGGAISNSGNLTVSDAIFRSNTTSGDGGAVYNGNGTVVISDTLFDSNSGSMGGGVYNTGIYNTPGNFVSVNNTWIQNKAGSGGGAIENQGKLVVVNNSFLNNNSSVNASLGQAVRNDGTAQIINSVYVNNTNKPDAQTAVKNISGSAADLFANDGTPDADGEIYIKSGSAADGKGVYVWHNADYSAIAYSTTETGAKTAVVGDASKATIQLDNFNSAGKPNIGSGKSEEAQSLEVTTTADTVDSLDNLTSLREAIAYAAILGGNQTITFGVDGIFELDSELALNSNITIDGNGTDKTILDGQDACRIFNIDSSATVTISDMTIQNGYAAADDNTGAGGGIRNAGTLTVENMLFKDNLAASTSNGGGAIWNNNSLTVKSSEFVNNTALWCGGAIFANANTIVEDSVFADNTAGRYGNIVYISKPGSVTFNNSTLELGSGSKAIHANGKLNIINSTLTGDLTNSDRVLIDVENGAVTIVNSIVSGTGTGNSINVSSSASGSLKLYYSVVGTVNGTISTNVSSDTGIAPDQIFSKLDSSGIPVTESDGTFAIILGGKAHKTGAFVWHNADYSAIAYSSSATGSKTAISGSTSSATTLVDTDQTGKTRGDFADRGAYELLNDGKEESSLIVTTTSDVENAYDGVTSLREAIAYAESKEGADEITFSVDGTIKFKSKITISGDVSIRGNGTDKTIFDGQGTSSLLEVRADIDVSISNVTFQNGYANDTSMGAAIAGSYYNPNLVIQNCDFIGNKTGSWGSCIYIATPDTLVVENCRFISNSLANGYSVIYTFSDNINGICPSVSISNSVFQNNTASCIINTQGYWGSLFVNNSVFTDNTSNTGSSGTCITVAGIDSATIINSTFVNNAGGKHYDSSYGSYQYSKAAVCMVNMDENVYVANNIFFENTDPSGKNYDLYFTNPSYNQGSGEERICFNNIFTNYYWGGIDLRSNNFTSETLADTLDENYQPISTIASSKGVLLGYDTNGVLSYSAGGSNWKTLGGAATSVGTTCFSTDQRGYLRNVNTSIGAYDNNGGSEILEQKSLIVTTTDDIVDATDGMTSLREALTYAATLGGTPEITFNIEGSDYLILGSALPKITHSISIDGTNAATGNNVTISVAAPGVIQEQDGDWVSNANGSDYRIFTITIGSSIDVTLKDMTLIGGNMYHDDGVAETRYGAAVYVNTDRAAGSSLTVDNVTFQQGNSYCAGGLFAKVETVNITNSEFKYNYTPSFGGGFTSESTDVKISDSLFLGNSSGGGSAIRAGAGTLSIERSVFTGNVSNIIMAGGQTGTYSVTDSIFYDNTGTAFNQRYAESTVTIRNSTFVNNTTGAALLNGSVVNSVFWGNDTQLTAETGVSITNSAIEGWSGGGTGNIALQIANTGTAGAGLYYAGFTDPENGNFTLTESSALINRGTNTGVSGQDIAGNTRIQQGTVDIGAYESAFDSKEKASLVVTTTSDVVDAYDNVTSLREAIAYAESKEGADEITFSVDGTFKFDSEITISTDITFTGNGTDKTIFDGQAKTRLFTINSGVTVKMSDLTIQGGYVSGYQASGGAIYNNGTLTVDGCTFLNNKVYDKSTNYVEIYGGAIYNTGTLIATNSTFASNSATQTYSNAYGGAVYNTGSFTATDCSFTQNSASGYTVYGGAIYSTGSLSITDSSFTENSVNSPLDESGDAYGGAIYNTGAISITGSAFVKNSSNGGFVSHGGAIYSSAKLRVSNSTFIENEAYSSSAGGQGSGYGGAIHSSNSLTITDCLFSKNSAFSGNSYRNTAYAYGGAIFNVRGSVSVINSTFTDNTANASTRHTSTTGSGGAIYGSALLLINNTFTGNIATSLNGTYKGGAICSISRINLINNIIVGNEGGSEVDGAKNSDINNLYTSTDVTVANTFAEVDADGKAVLDEDGTFHIKSGGPAHGKGVFVWHNEDYSAIAYSQTIDGEKTAVVGDVALATTLIATDQLGQTRTSPTDIGAVISEQQLIEIDPAASNFNCTITAQEYDGTNEVDNASIKVTIGGIEVELIWTSALFDSSNVDDVTSATFSGLYSLTPGYILSTDTITVDAAGKIFAKEITVSANNITQVYGDAEKTLTYEVSGLVGNDTLEGSLTRESGKNVGDYAISQGTLENSNYVISFTGADYTITKRDLTISANNIVNHTYGTAYTLTFNSDALANGDSFIGNLEIDPADANKSSSGHYAVGDHTITIGTLDIVDGNGADMSDNYTISYNGGTLNITPAEILLSGVTVADKVYDGTAGTTLNSWSFNSDLANNDDLTLSGNAAFGDKNAGSNKAVNVSDFVLSGSDAGNYTLLTNAVQTTASVSKAALEIKANDTGKVYNAADPVLDYTVLSGTLFGDDKITLSREAGENIGEYAIGQYLISDGNNGSNYDVDFTSGKFTIAGKNALITVGNTTLDYNGTLQDATEYTITGLESGHRVYSIDLEGARNAGSYAVSVESVIIHDASGNDVTGNYHLSYESGTLLINQAQITVNAVEQTITYGETAVPAYTYTGTLFGSDVFTGAMSINGAMNSRNTLYAAGTAKFEIGTLEISDGNGGNNYRITFNGADLTVKAKEISLSAVEIQDKVYDGNTGATVLNAEVSGIVAGDDLAVDISGAQGTFASKNAGDDVTVNASGFTLSGADKDNYILKSDEFATSADINKASLAIYAQNVSKTYGDADPKLTYRTEGLVTGDTLNGALERAAGENVGSYAISRGTLENSNYVISFTGADYTITKRDLTISANNIVNHTYGTAYTLTFNSDALANGDSFTGNLEIDPADANKSSSGHYAVGDHAITIGTLDIVDGNGADMSDNYTISYNGGTLNITPAEILLSGVTVADKVYDGTANATLNSWSFNSDLANNDDLTLSGTASFSDKNAGNDKTVNVSDFVLSGSDAGNYTLLTNAVQTTASVSKAALEIKANDAGKVYNAADPVLDYTLVSGEIFGDDKITLSREAGENTGEYVIGQYLISDGNNGSNYDVDFTAGKFTIAGKNALITVGNTTLDYNGTLQDATEYTITGLENGHSVYSIDLEGARDAGSYAVTVESVIIHDASGNDVTGNYHLSYESGTLLINQAQITVNAVEQTITYGETAVPAYTYTGTLFGSDVFTGAMSINGAMNSRNTLYAAGTAKFEIGTLEISDNNGGNNYRITFNGADLTIKAKEISLSAVEIQDKVYDGKVNATILNAEVSGTVTGDDLAVDISGAQGTFASKNAGNDVAVNASGFTLAGADKDNYILKSDEFATSADISKASLAIYAQNVSKTYGDADPKLTYRTEGLVTGDTLNGALERAAGENVGSYAISQGTLENSNYVISFTGAALTITAKELNVDPGNSELIWNISEQVYDGDSTVDNATLYINGMEVVFNNAFFNSSNVDDVTSATFNDLSIADSNYVLSAESITVDAAGKILARELAVKADDAEKISGEADPAFTWQLTGGELLNGDAITGTLDREAGEDAGLNRYAITQGTLSAGGNYNIVFTSGFLSIKENASLVVSTTSDVVNVYDGVTSLREAVAYAESTAGADEITFAVDGTFNFESEITLSSEITITGNGTDKTIFDGQDKTRFFTVDGDVTMSGITFQNGYTDLPAGAIRNNSRLTIDNSNFVNNSADSTGGALSNYSDLTISNSNFTDNSTTFGGAIYSRGGILTVSDSTFTGNNAEFGGAILSASDLIISNCSFTGNYTDNQGGAVYNHGGTLSIDSSSFANNSTSSNGGAIYNNGYLSVDNSTFNGNNAEEGGAVYNSGEMTDEFNSFSENTAAYGGAIYNQHGALAISSSSYINNNAVNYGGTVYNFGNDHTITISNGTFTGNTAENGGAIYNYGDLTVENSTFTQNCATSDGGAIYNDSGSTLSISGSGFTENSAEYGGAAYNFYGKMTVKNSCFTENSAGWYGGAAYNNIDGTLTIDSSTFIGNQAESLGGAVCNVQVISNSTFINNKAEYTDDFDNVYSGEGNAVCSYDANCTIVNSTFYSDAANSNSIIYSYDTAEINLINSIVVGSVSGNGKINAWYSVIDNTFVNGEYIGCKTVDDIKEIFEWDQDNDKPLFVTSEVDGVEQTAIKILEKSFVHGNGRFVWHDDSWSNIAVSRQGDGSDKVAIIGDAALAVTLIVKDQLAQDIDTTIPATSIGAYYLQPFEEDKSLTVTANDDVVDAYDHKTSLREALTYANELAFGKTGESITVTFAVDDVVLDDEIVIGSNLSGNRLQIGKYDSAEINISVKPDSNSRIFRFGDENDTTSVWDICLRGLSLSGGNATGKGGLVFIQGAEVTLDIYYSYFKDASATEDGGAIYSFSSGKQYVEISRTFFENNSALDGNGGALAIIAGGDLTVNLAHYSYDYIWFVDNSAGRTGWDSGNGGAVYIKGPDYGKGSSTVTIGNEYYSGTHFQNNHADYKGGAIYISDFNQDLSAPSSLTIKGCDFYSNTAGFEGGALSVVASGLWDIEISDSEFKSNKVEFVQENITIDKNNFGAGAISLYGHIGNWSILNSKFSNNSTNLTGGAIRMEAMPLTSACTPTVTVSGCTFTDNTADYDGGALYYTAYSGISMRISGSSFSGNTSNGNGGAIAISDYYLGNRNVLIENTTFTNNKAVDGGAIAMSYTGKWNSYELSDSLTLVNCSFVNNTATANGGAISASGTVSALTDVCITAVNSTFYGNTAANGGAIAMISSNATAELDLYLVNSTIIQNQGGGISLSSSNADSSVDLLNTIVFDNSANSDITVSNNQLNAFHSIIGTANTAIAGSGNRTAASISDIFATDSEGKVIVSNYTPRLKSNSTAQGGGVYVWHDADWSNIAWSTKADGSGKSSFKGTSNDASGLLTRDKNNNSINTALPATSIGAYYLAQQLLNVAVNAPGFSYTIEAQEYNGTANVADAEITITVNGETVKLSWNSALFNSSNVADVTSAVFSGLVSLNNAYALDTTTITLDAAGKIVAREITVTANAVTQVYGDAEKALTYEVSGLLGGDTLSGSLIRESGKNADDYEISLGTLANSNYIINYTGNTYTITKRDLTITANNIVDHTYGTAFTLNCTSSSLGAGDSFTGNLEIDPADANKSTSGHYAVGDHVITMGTLDIVDGNGDDMSDNYTISFNSGILNITPAEIQISAVTAADKVYDGNTGATVLDAEVSGTVAGDDISADITGVQANFASKNVGDDIAVNACGFTLAGADKGNYILKSDEFTASADISKASLAIYAQNVSKTYGDADPGFTAITEGLKTGDTVTGLGRSDNGSDIGNYDIDLYTLNDGNNGGNYEVTFHKGTLTVNAKPITVTADAVSKVYGSADPRLTYRADGLVGNDTLSGSLERAAGENVGTYAITQGTLDNSNYIISFTGAALSITAKELKIDFSNSDLVWTVSEQVYDGDNTVDNATLYINGMEVNWESAFFNSADVADITTVTFNGLSIADSNYILSSDSVTLDAAGKVLAREITVTADNVTQVYGDAEKALTYNVSGLIGDDTLSGSLTRESGKNAGDYEISLGTLANSNYIINFTGADYTITKRDLTITANNIVDHTYGTSFTLNCTSSSLGAGDSFTGNLEIDPADANKSTSGHYAVGDHVITMGTLDIVDGNGDDMSDNYTISFNSGILNITPAEIQISTVTAADKVYDGNTKAAVLAAEVSGAVAGDDIALDITGAQASFASKNAGNNVAVNACGFTLAGADKGNYILKSDEFTASANISKANLTICAQNAGKYYGEADPELTYNADGLIAGDTLSGTLVREPGERTGSYKINQGTLDNRNYNIDFTAGTFTITVDPEAVQPGQNYSGGTESNFSSTIPAMQTALDGKHPHRYGSVYSMEYRDLAALEAATVNGSAEKLPESGRSVDRITISEMTIDNISAGETDLGFSFKTPVKLHRSLWESFDLADELDVYAGDFAEKCQSLKSDFEKLLDNVMETI